MLVSNPNSERAVSDRLNIMVSRTKMNAEKLKAVVELEYNYDLKYL